MNTTIPIPAAGTIHVWSLALHPTEHTPTTCLDHAERDRHQRFKFDADRNRFAQRRTAWRHILAQYLEQQPDQLVFQANTYGKPFLPGTPIHFNASHSHEMAILAICAAHPMGIDIEYRKRHTDLSAITKRFFSPHEQHTIAQLPENQHTNAFYRCWTCKEAYIKACGQGLSLPLDAFDVCADPQRPAALLTTRPPCDTTKHWILHTLDVPSEYAAALACGKNVSHIEYFTWQG